MKLHVQLLEARNLRVDRPAPAYVHLKLGATKRNSTISPSGSPDPYWFEDFTFNVDDLGSELQVSVWNRDRFTDSFLGCLRLPVTSVFGAERQTIPATWYPLAKRSSRSKTEVTGEIRVGFTLSGRTSSTFNPLSRYPSSDVSNSSSVTSTPEYGHLPRNSSSDSFQSIDTTNSHEDGADSINNSSAASLLIHRFSTWLPTKVSSSFLPSEKSGVESLIEPEVEFNDENKRPDECDSSLHVFFEDDGKSVPSSDEDFPPALGGGVLLNRTYMTSAKSLNKIIFGPGSQFLKDLTELQKSTDMMEGPWRKGENNLPRRLVTYVKPATKLVKSVKAIEDQVYSRADEKGFVVNICANTPDAPYGNTFRIQIQYCIFVGAISSTGESTSVVRVSWAVNFLSSTMMKGFIESGARQGLQESYKQFAQVLEKYAAPYEEELENNILLKQEDAIVSTQLPKNDWNLVKDYFFNVRVCIALLSTCVVLMHLYFSSMKSKGGLEFWKLDLPDTLLEFITSAVVGVEVKHVFDISRKFMRARVHKRSDHGVKAKGSGWLLSVTLVGGENIPASRERTQPDPYVVFSCTGKKRTSSVKLHTSNPKWEERFEFDATEEAPSIMHVEVFNFEGPFTDSDPVGHVEINFLKKSPDELADLWVPLEGKAARASGAKIHLRIVLVNTKEADDIVHYIEKLEKEVGSKINRQSFMKNISFQRLFSLPSEEFLVNDFSCSLKRKFLIQGKLFLSSRVLAFYSNIFGHKTKFVLLWDDIEEIRDTSAPSSVGMLLNPTILVFTKKGRALDAQHGAKSVDAKGRLKFQFQSFIRYTPAYRTMTTLWKYRTLSPEQRIEMIANLEHGDEGPAAAHEHVDESDTLLSVEEVNLTEVYSTKLPLSVMSMLQMYENKILDERIAVKVGWSQYCSTSWETVGDDEGIQQRRLTFKLSNRISLLGTHVTCLQQKSKREGGHFFTLDEVWTLHDVPFGDNFQIKVRKEIEDTPTSQSKSTYTVFLGVQWQKATMFQNQISKNIFDRHTKHLKDIVNVSVKEILEYHSQKVGTR